jgi:hypothetical protein
VASVPGRVRAGAYQWGIRRPDLQRADFEPAICRGCGAAAAIDGRDAGLFLDQSTLKGRSRIKAGVIGPPATLSVFICLLNWKVSSAFFPPPASLRRGRPSSTWVGGNTGLELKCNARGRIHSELNNGEEAAWLAVREKG